METVKGREIRDAMIKRYGPRRGVKIYYASINNGRLKGTHSRNSDWEARSAAATRRRGSDSPQHYKLKPSHRQHISEGLKRANRARQIKGYNPAAHAV